MRARVGISLERPVDLRAELVTFTGLSDAGEHVACVVPGPMVKTPLVRVHSECLTGDVFGSKRCDCGPQLDEALRQVSAEGGAILYLRQEGRGIGLYNKLDTYLLQDSGFDTFEANRQIGRGADERDYRVAAEMLIALGIPRVRLLTNNPDKVNQLRAHGIEVVEILTTGPHVTEENFRYLNAKARLAGHTIHPDRRC
nr:GTP cyclohydrolase II [Actinosynnema sp. ALI-1.44]